MTLTTHLNVTIFMLKLIFGPKKLITFELLVSEVKVTQLCPTLCDPMACTVHGILQARIREWVSFPFSRGSSQPRDQTRVSCIAGRLYPLSCQGIIGGIDCNTHVLIYFSLLPFIRKGCSFY